jgi:hypothetical protein
MGQRGGELAWITDPGADDCIYENQACLSHVCPRAVSWNGTAGSCLAGENMKMAIGLTKHPICGNTAHGLLRLRQRKSFMEDSLSRSAAGRDPTEQVWRQDCCLILYVPDSSRLLSLMFSLPLPVRRHEKLRLPHVRVHLPEAGSDPDSGESGSPASAMTPGTAIQGQAQRCEHQRECPHPVHDLHSQRREPVLSDFKA